MLSLQDIKHHVHSIQGTAKITSAMQMVAASQMRHAQDAALGGRPLMELLYRMQRAVTSTATDYIDPLMQTRQVKNRCVILVSTDKGLCGALNNDVFDLVRQMDSQTTQFITVGRLANRFVKQYDWTLIADIPYSDRPRYSEAQAIAQVARERFLQGQADEVLVCGSHFVNTLVQRPIQLEYLPVGEIQAIKQLGPSPHDGEPEETTELDSPFDFKYEPDAETVLKYLLSRYLDLYMYQVLLDARASEHSARMVSMKAATENADGLIKELNLQYNKIRQENITNELLDISGGQAQ